jgi:hypothetical protein
LNRAHQFLACAVDNNILCESVHDVKKIREALLVSSKENDLEVNAEEARYMFLPRQQKV